MVDKAEADQILMANFNMKTQKPTKADNNTRAVKILNVSDTSNISNSSAIISDFTDSIISINCQVAVYNLFQKAPPVHQTIKEQEILLKLIIR